LLCRATLPLDGARSILPCILLCILLYTIKLVKILKGLYPPSVSPLLRRLTELLKGVQNKYSLLAIWQSSMVVADKPVARIKNLKYHKEAEAKASRQIASKIVNHRNAIVISR
jgi:hypothetical protein